MRSRTGRRPVRRVALAAMLAVATIGGTALAVGTANAELAAVTDDFDNNPTSRWSVTRTSQGGLASFVASRAAISANQTTGFTAINRTFRVPAVGRHECAVGIQLRTQGAASVRVNVEVIDPATFTYIALNEATVSSAQFRGFSASWSNGPIKDVLFRVSLLAAGGSRSVDIDSLRIVCEFDD